MDKTAFYDLSYGVYLCTSWDEGKPVGCVANSAMQITSQPATIAVSINKNNYTHKAVSESGHFALTVLGEGADPALIGTFGFRTSQEFDKFASTPYEVRGKLPVPDGGVAWFSCKVVSTMDTSTHTVFLGEVLDCGKLAKDTPMTYSYYHKVLKGKTAKNAPTYQAEEPAPVAPAPAAAKWVCSVCGYVYDGETPFEELPDSWTCPRCGVGKEFFKQQ